MGWSGLVTLMFAAICWFGADIHKAAAVAMGFGMTGPETSFIDSLAIGAAKLAEYISRSTAAAGCGLSIMLILGALIRKDLPWSVAANNTPDSTGM